MDGWWRWLESRVARRVLLLFVIGAVLPVAAMAGISFVAVNGQLERQSEERLAQLTKNAGQSILQQLLLVEGALRNAARAVRAGTAEAGALPLPNGVTAMSVVQDGTERALHGPLLRPPELDTAGRSVLLDPVWRMLLETERGPGGRFLATMAVDSADLGRGTLWAALEPDSIWGPAVSFASLPTVSDVCVVGPDGSAYACRSGDDALVVAYDDARVRAGDEPGSVLHVDVGGSETIVAAWTIFLTPAFATPPWVILVAESREALYAPLSSFRYSFFVALFLGLLVVLLLANVQVRRTMTPLKQLTDGTVRLAAGDLGARVPVATGDEFGQLADSFNDMAGRLGLQFRQLEAARAIDQAVLTAPDRGGVVAALLEQFGEVIDVAQVAVVLTEPTSATHATLRWRGQSAGEEAPIGLTSADQAWLRLDVRSRVVGAGEDRPAFASWSVLPLPPGPLVVLPLFVQGQLRGAVMFVPPPGVEPGAEAVGRARRIADQTAVALDEIRLVRELEEMSWGTLRALARAIDAKSRWTAGHSERVTELALKTGRFMGLPHADLEVLERGGLLHDIGKIGVPMSVLDFSGGLGSDDRRLIEQHPVIGGRILEPIKAFAPAMPIVVQHHERWDGSGYPDGLRGTEIHPLARVLAVADVYDAMASARPYRGSLDAGVVLAEIKAGAGRHFEPAVVYAFLDMMAAEGKVPNARRGIPAHG